MTIRNRLAWLLICVALNWAAWLALQQVQAGNLFLFPLSVDPPPFELEVSDAIATAGQWTLAALAFLSVASIAVLCRVRLGPIEAVRDLRLRIRRLFVSHSALCTLFVMACLMDFGSTAHYFHEFGISDEFHPGIKLITYAWGRTIGCLIAKSIQGILVLLVCLLFPRIAQAVLLATSVAYIAAAVWNVCVV